MKYYIQSVAILLLFCLDILNGLRLCRKLSGLSQFERRILSNYKKEGSNSYHHRNRFMTRLVIDPTTIDDFIVLTQDNSTFNNQNLSPSSLLAPSSLSQELLKQQRKKKSSNNKESSSEVGIIPTYQNLNESLGEGAFNASELFSKFPR